MAKKIPPVLVVPGASGPATQMAALIEMRQRVKRQGVGYSVSKDTHPVQKVEVVRTMGLLYKNETNLFETRLMNLDIVCPLSLPPVPLQAPVYRTHAHCLFPTDPTVQGVFQEGEKCEVCNKAIVLSYGIENPYKLPLSCGCFVHGVCFESYQRIFNRMDYECKNHGKVGFPRYASYMAEIVKGQPSGASLEGIKSVLDKMLRPEVVPNVNSEFLTAGLCRLMAALEYDGLSTIDFPDDFNPELFDDVFFESSRKCGLLSVPIHSDAYTNRPTKWEAHHAASYQASKLCARIFCIRDYMRDCRKVGSSLISSISVKSEIVYEPEKTRFFYLSGFAKYKIDRVLSMPIYRHLYNRGPISLGFVWGDGGANDLFHYLQGARSDYRYWHWDIRRMDQSIKAVLILMSYLFILMYYKSSNKYRLASILAAVMGDYTACKFVKWLDERDWRLVIGMIFSGEQGTSFIDTFVLCLAVVCYLLHVEEGLRAAYDVRYQEFRKQMVYSAIGMATHPFRFKGYGDDGIAGVPNGPNGAWRGLLVLEGSTDCLGVTSFKGFMLKAFDLELKPGAYGESDKLDCTVNGKGDIVRDGPIFLHRRFLRVKVDTVKGSEETIAAFRPTVESVQRLFNTMKDSVYPETMVAKVVGSMYDTQGTNGYAFQVMELELEMIRKSFYSPTYDPLATYTRAIRSVANKDVAHLEWLDEAISNLKKNLGNMYTWEDLLIPTRETLIRKYLRPGPPRPIHTQMLKSWREHCEIGDN